MTAPQAERERDKARALHADAERNVDLALAAMREAEGQRDRAEARLAEAEKVVEAARQLVTHDRAERPCTEAEACAVVLAAYDALKEEHGKD